MRTAAFGWPGLESHSSKPRGFLRFAQSSPGHPLDETPLFEVNLRGAIIFAITPRLSNVLLKETETTADGRESECLVSGRDRHAKLPDHARHHAQHLACCCKCARNGGHQLIGALLHDADCDGMTIIQRGNHTSRLDRRLPFGTAESCFTAVSLAVLLVS